MSLQYILHQTSEPFVAQNCQTWLVAELVVALDSGFKVLNLADLFCRITRFLGLCRLVLPTCWGLWVVGHLSWRRHLLWDTA